MKRKGVYVLLVVVVLGFVSFKTISASHDKKAPAKQKSPNAASKSSGNLSFEFNDDGSTQLISWIDAAGNSFTKAFAYNGSTVNIIEKKNDTIIKQEKIELMDGNIVSLKATIPGSQVDYTMHYSYNKRGQLEKVTYGNGTVHEYEYDSRANLTETKWYDRNGQIIVTAKKRYFPTMPDEYTHYSKLLDRSYAAFIPPFAESGAEWLKMTNKVEAEISFDGKYAYTMDNDGYIKKGLFVDDLAMTD